MSVYQTIVLSIFMASSRLYSVDRLNAVARTRPLLAELLWRLFIHMILLTSPLRTAILLLWFLLTHLKKI